MYIPKYTAIVIRTMRPNQMLKVIAKYTTATKISTNVGMILKTTQLEMEK